MCGLCGVLGSKVHWTDSDSKLANRRVSATFRRERLYQIEIINKIIKKYGLHISDWHGASFLISSSTGATEIVNHIASVWEVAKKMSGKFFDPLDLTLLENLPKGQLKKGQKIN